MRPEGVRRALYEAEGRPSVVILNYILTGSDLNTVDFRNIAAIEVRKRRRA